MSRGFPQDGNWSLHTTIIMQILDRFGRAKVDLFARRGNAQCNLWFSLISRDDPPLGVDVFPCQLWPDKLIYAGCSKVQNVGTVFFCAQFWK